MDLALTKDGDLLITPNGDVKLVDSVAQKIRTKILWFAGEYKWDKEEGLPYMDYLLVKNPNTDYVESLLREAIFSIAEVTDVREVSVTYDTKSRKAKIKFAASTDEETITEEVALSV